MKLFRAFLSIHAELLKRGVEVRLIHAKAPGPISQEDFDRYPILARRLERALCPRVHFLCFFVTWACGIWD